MIEVSVVIPTLNEEKTIGICIDKINKIFDKYQINGEIIVSDSSTDSTPDIANQRVHGSYTLKRRVMAMPTSVE